MTQISNKENINIINNLNSSYIMDYRKNSPSEIINE